MDPFETLVFPLGLGTSKLRSLNGGVSARAAQRLLEYAFDQGIRLVDTAPSYGQGQAETAIGRLPQQIRDELVVCSKVGYSFGRKAALINAVKPLVQSAARSLSALRHWLEKSRRQVEQQGSISLHIDAPTIRASLGGSLRRLRRDRLDILLLHDPSAESLNDDNQAALDRLERDGQIASWGVSTRDIDVARRAVQLEGLAALQVPVKPAWIAAAGDLFEQCRRHGIAVIANSVLSTLHGRADAAPSNGEDPRGIEECFQSALQLPGVRILLCGTTNAAHLATNVQVMRRLVQSAADAKNKA